MTEPNAHSLMMIDEVFSLRIAELQNCFKAGGTLLKGLKGFMQVL